MSARLRDSLARRQELMVRYQATRERLNRLKNQRTTLAQEERKVMQKAGAPESPYEDPIPGVEKWSIEQLHNGIKDFRVLKCKIDALNVAYNEKLRVSIVRDAIFS